mgnify:FL=1
MGNAPIVLVFAGPNGSGKSTVTKGFDIVGEYINADEIKKEKNCSDLEAAQFATALREDAVYNMRSFTFETVLSSSRNVELLKKAKNFGYQIEIVYVLTADPQINVSRVAQHVKNGGHDVPMDKIISRYYKSLNNISKIIQIADVMWVVDNSTEKAELIIYSKENRISINATSLWKIERIKELISGNIDFKI